MTLLDEIESCIPALRCYAYALVRDREGADDLVQDCLERALARRSHWRGDGPVRAWLFRILLNRFRDQRRGVAASVRLVPAGAMLETARVGDQEDRLALREVHEAIGRLPTDQRAALLLVALEGFSLADAAKALDIPEGTLTSRLARARQTLRRATGRNGGGPGDRLEVVR
jgi:RNA polymerase sigma-70 factor, ECF subfamily